MHLYRRGVEFASSSPEILALGLSDISGPFRVIGGVVAGATVLGLAIKNSYKQVPEGYVGIRTFNGRAIDDDGNPLHELLEPGGHWMILGLHDVEHVNRQHQTTLVETTIDAPHSGGFEQFKLGAVVTWGVLSDESGIRPIVTFENAYRQYYEIDTSEDLETKVAGVATRYLIGRVLGLSPKSRTVGVLNRCAEQQISSITSLAEYGVGIYGIEITEFSRAGVIQFGIPAVAND